VETKVNIDQKTLRALSYERATRYRRRQHQWVHRVAGVIAMVALSATGFASAAQQPQTPFTSFQVPRSDLAAAEELANQLSALSPRVNRTEAKLLADCAYTTVTQLRREYRMFGTPIFNNFLIYQGLKKRGYCYQWSEDLLIALDALRLTSLELRWGESNPDNWRENNCLVVTAKGQPFRSGIMLDCWRHFGHLYFHPVASDTDPFVENRKYAHFVLARSAERNSSGANHRVAFQRSNKTSAKTGD